MAFAMRDEGKAEPVSITGAEYVEPSPTELIQPGQRVAHLFPRAVMEEYVLQRVTGRVWWVSRHFYGSLFYVGKRGVLLLDPFLGGADATLAAIASVTALPVTAVGYSHFHADHVGGRRRLELAVPLGSPPSHRRARVAVRRAVLRGRDPPAAWAAKAWPRARPLGVP